MLGPQQACNLLTNPLATSVVYSYQSRRHSVRCYLPTGRCCSPMRNSPESTHSCDNRRRILHSDYDMQGISPLRLLNGDRSLVLYI